MQVAQNRWLRPVVVVLAVLLAMTGYTVSSASVATASEVTLNSTVAPRRGVTADSLPTVQVNGVIWALEIVGNTVFAGGQFTQARPAGSPPGTNEVARQNFLAFNLTTGELITEIDPGFNARVNDMAVSADGQTLYVVGSFTAVSGQGRYRIAALDVATGKLKPGFEPGFDATINSVDVKGDVVYLGGAFSKAGSLSRRSLAAVNATTGATLSWAPSANGQVQGVAATPDGSRVVVSGNFSTINGAQARGLGAVTADSGDILPFPANQVFQNYGTDSSNFDLKMYPDGTVYGTGFAYSSRNPNFMEGVFAVNSYTGQLVWLADCHGDSYDVTRLGDAVYSASHHHNCSNIGSYPEAVPSRYQHTDAFTAEPTGTVRRNTQNGYPNFAGQPAPTMINWWPTMTVGTFTGQGQAAWTLASNDQYLIAGGEFPSVNGVAQQGLARFTVAENAPKKQGPREPEMTANAIALSGDRVRLSWTANWDRDDLVLNYRVFREGNSAPVCEASAPSTFWERPGVSCLDVTAELGAHYRYRVVASDPDGNELAGAWTELNMPTQISPYQSAVAKDGPSHYWRMGTRAPITDLMGSSDLLTAGSVSTTSNGAVPDDPATTFSGTNATAGSQLTEVGPDVFTIEAWFRTTSLLGGKIVGFGSSQLGISDSNDRHIYLTNDGRVVFGVYPNVVRTIISPNKYNDGDWHHVAATLSPAGMALYLDGRKVAARTDTTSAEAFSGYWRVGSDNLSGWPSSPLSRVLRGSIDEVAIYPQALGPRQVAAHYTASGRANPLPPAPADALGAAVFNDDPALYWRLNETAGTVADDSSINDAPGNYLNSPSLNRAESVQGRAVQFDGTNDSMASNLSYQTPASYSHELWFQTTTGGGRLIGFSTAASGTSGTFDRGVSMTETGQLSFTSGAGSLTTAASYNDGRYHHLVATQGPDGMRLYVDGVLAGSNDTVATNPYLGYLRVGGNGPTGTGRNHFAGYLDEVAFYPTVLNIDQVRGHYRAAGVSVNQAPSADLAVECDQAGRCEFQAAGTDPDGKIVGYAWDFGDGTIAETAATYHQYAASGSYRVKLTVTDDQGATGVATHDLTVQINQPPVASFTVSCNHLVCTFDSSASHDPDGTLASVAWEFGDGSTAAEPIASHTYAEAGVHQVQLSVVDNNGLSATTSQQVEVVANQPPTPVIVVSCTELTCQFDATGSADTDGSVVAYQWSLGDQNTATGATVTHSYSAPGNYQIALIVTDNDGASATATRQVEVFGPNAAPQASFTSSSAGLALTVDASASADPDGVIASYHWDFGDGASGNGVQASHSYATPGEYQVKLTVTDDHGATATTSSKITIEAPANQPPTASFVAQVTGLNVQLDASASTDPDGVIASYHWDFGDGASGSGVQASHSYATAGEHLITLTVTDQAGASASSSSTVNLTAPVNQAPTATFTFSASNLTANFDASAATDPDGVIASYHWDFGDGTSGTGVTAQHNYASAGSYQVTLKVTDDHGAVATATQTVAITSPPETGQPVVVARDTFTRSGTTWGAAELGGNWTYLSGAAALSTNGSQGLAALPVPGYSTQAKLGDVHARDVQLDLAYTLPEAPVGNGVQQTLIVRQIDNSTDYRMTVWVPSDGLVRVNLTARAGGATTSLGDRVVPGLSYQPGQTLRLSFVAQGGQSTALSAYVWLDGQPRPETPALTRTDNTPALQEPGAIGVRNYLTGSSAATTVHIDDLLVTDLAPQVVVPPANQAPIAAFALAADGLGVSFDVSGSHDPDGTVASYHWDFGDQSTGTGGLVSHRYANPGSYQVTLTVTDDRGDTGTITHDVVVSEQTNGVLVAKDGFTRTAPGWGTADLGGPWTPTSGTANFSTNGSQGVSMLNAIRDTNTIRLNDQMVSDVRVAASFELVAPPTGSGVHQTLIARQINGGTDYRFTAWVAADNQVRVNLSARDAWAATSFGDLVVNGLVWQPGDVINMAFEVTGSGTTKLAGYVWKAGAPMPVTPTMTATDTTAALQGPGRVGLANYLTGSATVVPVEVRWDDVEVRRLP